MQEILMHSGPLGLDHYLLNVVTLPFCCVISEDWELVQLETNLESSPWTQTPSCGHSTIHSSPRVTLMHLDANPILLGLQITGQEVPQKLVPHGNRLIVSLLSFFEHLLGWLSSTLQTSWSSVELEPVDSLDFWRFSRVPANLSTGLVSLLQHMLSPFWLMRHRTATIWARYSLVLPHKKMVMLKTVPSLSLTSRLSDDSLVMTRSLSCILSPSDLWGSWGW